MTARRTLMAFAGAFCLTALGGCGLPPADDAARPGAADDAGLAQKPVPNAVPNAVAAPLTQATSDPVTLGPESARVEPVEMAKPLPPSPVISADGPVAVTVAEAPRDVPPEGGVDARLGRLETQMADMHHTLDMMMPALTRLSLAQQNLQNVLTQVQQHRAMPVKSAAPAAVKPRVKITKPALRTVSAAGKPETGNLAHAPRTATDEGTRKAQAVIARAAGDDNDATGPAAPTAKPALARANREPAGPPPKNVDVTLDQAPVAAAVPASSGGLSVNGIRIGEHGNMTRLVLDLTGRASFTTRLDASGTLLTVRMPGTAWRTGATSTASNSRTVDSYTATPDGQGGTVLALRLKRPASVSWSDTLPPSSDAGYRAVIDLTPKG